MEDIQNRRELVRRFLQTAVVVDDEAYMAPIEGAGPKVEVVTPGRRPSTGSEEGQGPASRGLEHSLDARAIMESFYGLGVVCGVVGPKHSTTESVRQADIVILDWLLKGNKPECTLKLLEELLVGEREQHSLRLVAIYTGEATLEDIYQIVFEKLKDSGLDPKANGDKTAIPYRHGRLVLYAKSGVNLAGTLKDRSVAEEELPKKLVDDFVFMTEGLLPGIALTSLTAVREGEHKILDRFSAELDPAFLAHRACLPDPEDAERQIVAHVAEELRGLADEAVAAESPAGKQAVKSWVQQDGRCSFEFGQRKLDLEETIRLATEGLDKSALGKSAFDKLSSGFARDGDCDLDRRLAWIMSFRTVYNAPPPTLWLGSVVTVNKDGDAQHLICIRPRCDSVRLKEETTFGFLRLRPPAKNKPQIVIEIDQQFRRLSIELDSSGWVLSQFQPEENSRAVTATMQGANGGFEFKDTSGTRYEWQGELKAEYAQRIVQTFATVLSRVAVDESEWLRRMAER